MERQTDDKLLETRIMDSLASNELIPLQKRNTVLYNVEENGYVRARTWITGSPIVKRIVDNAVPLSLAGLAVAAGIYFIYPETPRTEELTKIIGSMSAGGLVVKALIPSDRWFSQSPAEIATTIFKNNARPWADTYHDLRVVNKKDLNRYMRLAKSPGAIVSAYSDEDNQKAIGVTFARLTDILSGINHEYSPLNGLRKEHVIERITKQRIGSEFDTQEIDLLRRYYSPKQLEKLLEQIEINPERTRKTLGVNYDRLETLRGFIDNYELGLRLMNVGDIAFIGSQISYGLLDINGEAGDLAGSYAGMHSSMLSLPRVIVHGNAGRSFFTKSRRGYGHIRGNAAYGLMDGSQGGVVQVDNLIDGIFAKHMDDKVMPAIVVAIGGVTFEPEEGTVRNGLIISLNKNVTIGKPPVAYYFRNGKMRVIRLDDKSKGDPVLQACGLIDMYSYDWAKEYRYRSYTPTLKIAA
jgi:hypothetical protein